VHSLEGLPGAAMVTRGGQVKMVVASRLAGAGVKCTPQTWFQICSVSEQFAVVDAAGRIWAP
jgi:CubicO group peptidase (beta-lactamase class C family)